MDPLTLALLAGGALLLARARQAAAAGAIPGSMGGTTPEGQAVSRVIVIPKGQPVKAATDVIGTLAAGETVGLSRVPTDRPLATLTGTGDPTKAIFQIGKVRIPINPTVGPGFLSGLGSRVGTITGEAVGFIVGGPQGAQIGGKIGSLGNV